MKSGRWKVLAIVALIGLLATGFSGCAGEESKQDPKTTIEDFVTTYNNRDVDGLYGLFSPGVKSEHPKEEFESQLEMAKSFGVKITGWEVESKKIVNSTAILKVNTTSYWGGKTYQEDIQFSMVYEDGKWLIDNWPWKEHGE